MAYTKPAGQIGYGGLHDRVRRWRGKASALQCVRCPAPAFDWARVHTEDGLDAWADYVPMCRRCHMEYDRDARPEHWLFSDAGEPRRKAAVAATWTPQRRARTSVAVAAKNVARWEAMTPAERDQETARLRLMAGNGLGSRKCQPGCGCGRHRR